MNEIWLKTSRLAALGLAWLALSIGGCGVGHTHSAWMYPAPPLVPSPAPQVKEIDTRVQAAASADGAAATAIRTNAVEGKALTPPNVLPTLSQFWDAIVAGADRVNVTAQDLAALHQRMDDLAAQITRKDAETSALRTALASANVAITAEHDARLKAQQAEAKAKSDQTAHLQRLLFGVAVTSLLGLGAAVTIGLLLHDVRISIAGGAGCLAMALGCFLLGEVIYYRFWILSGLGAVAAILAIYELLAHRQQILAGLQTMPAPVAASSGVTPKTA